MDLSLELRIEDAIHRIKHLYEYTEGRCVLSFSGGKDSTVVAEIYLMAKERGIIGEIPLIFADTQVEYNAIYEFIEWFSENKQEVIYIKPEKPFSQIMKEYGVPAMSKTKSELIGMHNVIQEQGREPFLVKNTSELVTGFITGKEKEILLDEDMQPKVTRQRLANKNFNLVHPDNEYKVSSKCCDFLKKRPFTKYYQENDIHGYITGMRIEEGGVRAEMYTSCTSFKNIGYRKKKRQVMHKMPLFDWSSKDVDDFIEEYDIKISKAYTEYGLDRTGCIGCPFARDVEQSLKVLYQYEPNKYKAVQKWMGLMYMDLGIKLDFDFEYMFNYNQRREIAGYRRYEMLQKYRPAIAWKWKERK